MAKYKQNMNNSSAKMLLTSVVYHYHVQMTNQVHTKFFKKT